MRRHLMNPKGHNFPNGGPCNQTGNGINWTAGFNSDPENDKILVFNY